MIFKLKVQSSPKGGGYVDFIRVGYGPDSYLCSMMYDSGAFGVMVEKLTNLNWLVPCDFSAFKRFWFKLMWGQGKISRVGAIGNHSDFGSSVCLHAFIGRSGELYCSGEFRNPSPYQNQDVVMDFQSVIDAFRWSPDQSRGYDPET